MEVREGLDSCDNGLRYIRQESVTNAPFVNNL